MYSNHFDIQIVRPCYDTDKKLDNLDKGKIFLLRKYIFTSANQVSLDFGGLSFSKICIVFELKSY